MRSSCGGEASARLLSIPAADPRPAAGARSAWSSSACTVMAFAAWRFANALAPAWAGHTGGPCEPDDNGAPVGPLGRPPLNGHGILAQTGHEEQELVVAEPDDQVAARLSRSVADGVVQVRRSPVAGPSPLTSARGGGPPVTLRAWTCPRHADRPSRRRLPELDEALIGVLAMLSPDEPTGAPSPGRIVAALRTASRDADEGVAVRVTALLDASLVVHEQRNLLSHGLCLPIDAAAALRDGREPLDWGAVKRSCVAADLRGQPTLAVETGTLADKAAALAAEAERIRDAVHT